MATCMVLKQDIHEVKFVDLEPGKKYIRERIMPKKYLKEVQIGRLNSKQQSRAPHCQ